MDQSQRTELETAIRRRCEERDFDGAVSAALRGYGPEVFGFLLTFHRDEADASEVFSLFTEGIWRGLAGFSWSSSFRTWAYVIARRASLRHRESARRRAARETPLPEGSALSAIEEEIRTATLTWMRTERRNRLVQLRESLPPEDQALLMLRVNQQLSWTDLARVLHRDDADLNEQALNREAARLRKRFQLVKEKLYEMARQEGLVDGTRRGRGTPPA